MKISFRILLINFAVVVAILTISAAAFYSVMYNITSSQQARYVVNSANNFLFSYRGLMQDTEDEFLFLEKNKFPEVSPQNQKNIDFVFLAGKDSLTPLKPLFSGEGVFTSGPHMLITDFLSNNPYAVVKSTSIEGKRYYYGRIFNENVLNILSQRIGAELALVWNNSTAEISNSSDNKKYSKVIEHAYFKLQGSASKTFSESAGDEEIIAAKFNAGIESEFNRKLQFIIFTRFDEASDLTSGLTDVLILIGFTSVILSLILTMIFTHKIRKQITDLHKATEVLKEGDLKQRIKVKSKDELGALGNAFNNMLEVLSENEKLKNQYSEFISLINQNPNLVKISEASLENIMRNGGFIAGSLYLFEENGFRKWASFGFDENEGSPYPELLMSVVEKREQLHIDSDADQGYKNISFIPVIYFNKVIAVLELASAEPPSNSAREYLSRIQEQLAIGLTNALAFTQLENVVEELKRINQEYQKQNIQIRDQNEVLIGLHRELKEKANELEIQKSKAEESTKLKSQFLASMSHELRTPMNSVLGLTGLILEESSLTGKNRERLEVVLKSSKRLMALINDILDFSRLEAGKTELHEEEILLEDIISELEASVNPLMREKNLQFVVKRQLQTNIMIVSDRGKLMQILVNLLGNANKFTEKGFVEFRISSPSDDILQFDIKDTGIGISPEDKDIIFHEFRQADGSTTRKYDGTGLGLAISSRLCSFLKGTLSLQSSLNEGSTFTLKIPFVKGTSAVEPVKIPFSDTLFKNRRNPILIIDDDEEARATIGHYLDSRGYNVVFAENRHSGLSLALSLKPFAVILDLMLPNKEGWTILEELKERKETKDIPVILISVLGDKKAGYGLGAFDYFVKPIARSEFLSAINKLENLASRPISKIVIVDDDELEFEKFRTEFRDEHIRIDFIKESEFAFAKIREIQPDLVIIDLLMPSMDGITLSHKLKSSLETRHIPIIISTSRDISDKEKTALQDIVESITIKGEGHTFDVLKVVRDRIKLQEAYSAAYEVTQMSVPEGKEEKSAESETLLDVLIVDDDPDALYTLDELVKSCGCTTTVVRGGTECLSILEQKRPDLILLDIMMPVMDGFQTFNKIRQNEKLGNIPVYAVTAKAMLEDKNIIIKHGFDDYIFKPVSAGILAFKLKKLFYKTRVNQ